MVAKKAGISPDLLIHPGKTISDVLARGISLERNWQLAQVSLWTNRKRRLPPYEGVCRRFEKYIIAR